MTQVKAEFAKWVKQYGVHCDDDDPNARADSCGECRECGGECVRKPSAKTGGECIHRYEAPLPGPPERRGRGAHVVGGRAHLRGGSRGGRANGRGKMLQSRGAAKGKGGGAPFGKSGGAPWKPPSPKKVDHLRSKQEGKQSAAALRQHAAATTTSPTRAATCLSTGCSRRCDRSPPCSPRSTATPMPRASPAPSAGGRSTPRAISARRPPSSRRSSTLTRAPPPRATPSTTSRSTSPSAGGRTAPSSTRCSRRHRRRRRRFGATPGLSTARGRAPAARGRGGGAPRRQRERAAGGDAGARRRAAAAPRAARERMGGRARDALVKAHPPACAARGERRHAAPRCRRRRRAASVLRKLITCVAALAVGRYTNTSSMPLIVDDYGGTPLHYAALAAGAPAGGGAPLAWGDANVALLLDAQPAAARVRDGLGRPASSRAHRRAARRHASSKGRRRAGAFEAAASALGRNQPSSGAGARGPVRRRRAGVVSPGLDQHARHAVARPSKCEASATPSVGTARPLRLFVASSLVSSPRSATARWWRRSLGAVVGGAPLLRTLRLHPRPGLRAHALGTRAVPARARWPPCVAPGREPSRARPPGATRTWSRTHRAPEKYSRTLFGPRSPFVFLRSRGASFRSIGPSAFLPRRVSERRERLRPTKTRPSRADAPSETSTPVLAVVIREDALVSFASRVRRVSPLAAAAAGIRRGVGGVLADHQPVLRVAERAKHAVQLHETLRALAFPRGARRARRPQRRHARAAVAPPPRLSLLLVRHDVGGGDGDAHLPVLGVHRVTLASPPARPGDADAHRAWRSTMCAPLCVAAFRFSTNSEPPNAARSRRRRRASRGANTFSWRRSRRRVLDARQGAWRYSRYSLLLLFLFGHPRTPSSSSSVAGPKHEHGRGLRRRLSRRERHRARRGAHARRPRPGLRTRRRRRPSRRWPRTASSAACACAAARASRAVLASVAARRVLRLVAEAARPSRTGPRRRESRLGAEGARAHRAPVAVAPTKAIGRRAGSAAPGSAAPGADAPSSPSSSRVGSRAGPRLEGRFSLVVAFSVAPRRTPDGWRTCALCARFPETDGRPSVETREGLASTRRGIASARRADRETVSSSSVAMSARDRTTRTRGPSCCESTLSQQTSRRNTAFFSWCRLGRSRVESRSFVSVAFAAFVVDAKSRLTKSREARSSPPAE